MKYILCDVDGVVINGFHVDPARRVSWAKTLQEDLCISPDALAREFFLGPFSDVMIGKTNLEEALGRVLPQLSFSGDPEDFISYWFEKDSNINQDFLDWVKSIREKGEIKIFLATNQEHRRADYLWNNLGLSREFDSIYYAAKIGYKKPDPLFFTHILDDLGVESSDVLLIDDDPENIDVAQSLGMSGIVFNDMSDILKNDFLFSN